MTYSVILLIFLLPWGLYSNFSISCEISSSHGGTYEVQIFFWDVLPCKIIVDRRFRGARRQFWTSYSPPWELEISQGQLYFIIWKSGLFKCIRMGCRGKLAC